MIKNDLMLTSKSAGLDWFSKPNQDHLVQFYSSKSDLLSSLQTYIKEGLASGETCLVVARKAHVDKLKDGLIRGGVNTDKAHASGRLKILDAAETLASFMVNGLPDRERFFAGLGAVVHDVSQLGKPIRAYGEMVALLWEEGNKQAVILLEKYWNELSDNHQFSLYCAYPEMHFLMHPEVLHEIRNCHSHYASAAA